MPQIITRDQFGAGQQDAITKISAAYIQTLIQIAPQLGPHLMSGGTFEIKTMSGAHLKFGFSPQAGGLVLPGGITPKLNPKG